MNIKMDLSEILLYFELFEKEKKRRPWLNELNMMLYFLEDYDQVEVFHNKLQEEFYNLLQNRFISGSLIYFIEDYEVCIKLKEKVLNKKSKRFKYKMMFEHQILLSKTKEQAIKIIKEAKDFEVEFEEEWTENYDSLELIRERQKKWRKKINIEESKGFPELYEDFIRMKSNYFESLSLQQIKGALLNQQQLTVDSGRKMAQTSAFTRSVYIKEFARRVSNGICQLCEKEAPFLDKQGTPFLEVHHIHYLSKGGTDTINNVVALCPNCHRKIHQLELEEDFKKISIRASENMLE
ncbi:HNH endonuclease [Peribacillus frigoritolerans]|uniref:HNH endonuclease n=1 Tax=Peribacillus frigoritolerans TaxID=450367 RepID=UPI002E22FCD1|nr:HNH endonuclease [Peribacillus frigoritolerans]MED4635000.1 HNH endonuclease [Peribacillus frigoritolerans]